MAGVSDDKEGQSVWSWTISLWAVWSHDQTPPFSCPARRGEVTKTVSYRPTDNWWHANLYKLSIQNSLSPCSIYPKVYICYYAMCSTTTWFLPNLYNLVNWRWAHGASHMAFLFLKEKRKRFNLSLQYSTAFRCYTGLSLSQPVLPVLVFWSHSGHVWERGFCVVSVLHIVNSYAHAEDGSLSL